MSPPARIACVHATPRAVEPTRRMLSSRPGEFAAEDFVEPRLLKIADDRDAAFRLFVTTIRKAADRDPAVVLTTCSIFTRELPRVRESVHVPLLGVDEPMIERASEIGGRIALVGSVESSVENTADLILERSRGSCEIAERELVDKDACRSEEGSREFAERLQTLRREFDAVVVTQISLARAAEMLSEDEQAAVLSSPPTALARLREIIGAGR